MDKTAITVADLYRQRWGVETVIDSLKNQFLLMVFSGLKPEAMFLVEEPAKIIEELVVFFAQNKIPVIPNKPKPKRQKSLAKRRNLVVQNNYRKAI
jgi:hypothetical protein